MQPMQVFVRRVVTPSKPDARLVSARWVTLAQWTSFRKDPLRPVLVIG